jgi:hypothetical protein
MSTLDDIWVRYENYIESAATSDLPMKEFSQEEKDIFNKLVFRNLFKQNGIRKIDKEP